MGVTAARDLSPRTAISWASTSDGGRIAGSPTVRRPLIHDTRIGEVDDVVLRDRRHLAEEGGRPVVVINKQTAMLEGVPEIITRGS